MPYSPEDIEQTSAAGVQVPGWTRLRGLHAAVPHKPSSQHGVFPHHAGFGFFRQPDKREAGVRWTFAVLCMKSAGEQKSKSHFFTRLFLQYQHFFLVKYNKKRRWCVHSGFVLKHAAIPIPFWLCSLWKFSYLSK